MSSKYKIVDGEKRYINICKICGDEFLGATPRGKYCSKQHYRKCENCGKEFKYNAPFKSRYCSTACASAARAYKYDCVCRICGKHFKGRNSNSDVCQRPHPWHCVICGTPIIIKEVKAGRNEYTCDKPECRLAFRKKNALAKYGVDDVKKTPEQRKIASINRRKAVAKQQLNKKRVLDKESSNQAEFEDLTDNNDIINVPTPKSSIINKQKTYSPAQEHLRKSMIDKYGVQNASQLDSVKEKKRQAYLKKYGVDNPMKSKEVQAKRRKQHIEKYGTSAYDKVIMTAFKTNNKKLRHEWDHLNETIQSWKKKPTLQEVADYFDVSYPVIDDKINQGKLDETLLQRPTYQYEARFNDFLNNNFPGINVIKHDRTLIAPFELDFYFPDNNLAVELSPSRTHNVKSSFGHKSVIDKDYHKNKFTLCSNKNVELITVFDWHDWNKITEMIAQKLNGTTNRIYARKTIYKEDTIIKKDVF